MSSSSKRSKKYTANEKAIAEEYGVDVELIHRCVVETSYITGSSTADIHKCVMEKMQGNRYIDLPDMPQEIQGVMFGMFPAKDFIKICTLNIRHAENCKKAWYWKAYLADKELPDWQYILDFLMDRGYEDNYKLFLDIFGEFTKKYKADIEKGMKTNNGRRANKVITKIKRFSPYFKHYDRDIHGLVSDMKPKSKYYVGYRKLHDGVSNHLPNESKISDTTKFDNFIERLVPYIKFDTVGMDDIIELDEDWVVDLDISAWIGQNSKTAEDILMAATYFEKAGLFDSIDVIETIENVIEDANIDLLKNIEKYVNEHGKFGPIDLDQMKSLIEDRKSMIERENARE